jgi:CHAT domain-containing protein
VAGARQVLATLWPVADQASATLVGALFAGLAQAEAAGNPPDIARLLRDAKRMLRADARWAHPAFWAPFVLSGQGTNSNPGIGPR